MANSDSETSIVVAPPPPDPLAPASSSWNSPTTPMTSNDPTSAMSSAVMPKNTRLPSVRPPSELSGSGAFGGAGFSMTVTFSSPVVAVLARSLARAIPTP